MVRRRIIWRSTRSTNSSSSGDGSCLAAARSVPALVIGVSVASETLGGCGTVVGVAGGLGIGPPPGEAGGTPGGRAS